MKTAERRVMRRRRTFPDFPGVAVDVDVDDIETVRIKPPHGLSGNIHADRARLAGADIDRSVGGDRE
jgi:hypothetical protein